jgi:hypothetical protein
MEENSIFKAQVTLLRQVSVDPINPHAGVARRLATANTS